MDLRLVIGFVGIIVIQLSWLASGNVVFQVQHKFGGNIIKTLSQFKAHDSHRHRRILSAVDLPIGGDGSPTSAALYFTKIQIGTPPKDYHVQVDTGSDLLWVNCAGCKKCPKKSDLGISLALFNPEASSTAKIVDCNEDICISTLSGPSSDCKVGMYCSYSVSYGDGSSTLGYFVRDNVQLDRVSGDLQITSMNGSVAFGCGSQQSGELGGSSQQALDGILGFGQANSSMLSQLASAKKLRKIFSHCLDGSQGGGIFAIGEVVQPKVQQTTPMIPEAHYNVELKTIEVGGDILQLPTDIFDVGEKRGTIIDSGTTLAYLPDLVYKQVLQKIEAAQPGLKSHIVEQQFTCYKYSGDIDNGFPDVIFHFENSLSLKVYPHQYMFEVADQDWCVGFQDSDLQSQGKEITLLGDLVLTDKLVTYDLEKKTIGWVEYNCSTSITVKDEQSGNGYKVGAHNISGSGRICTSTNYLVSCLMFLLTVIFINTRID
ncbi:aspartic proteinase 36-like [Rutidosis leptorrhynchoides]|uniref:aspartic proteinase 36-like n=1 Tax=Rutidosis leptorrhynchoides TaxID=125765 RepID=UPI003A9929A1